MSKVRVQGEEACRGDIHGLREWELREDTRVLKAKMLSEPGDENKFSKQWAK